MRTTNQQICSTRTSARTSATIASMLFGACLGVWCLLGTTVATETVAAEPGSVLVGSREATWSDAEAIASDGALEPLSRDSDLEPDLATDQTNGTAPRRFQSAIISDREYASDFDAVAEDADGTSNADEFGAALSEVARPKSRRLARHEMENHPSGGNAGLAPEMNAKVAKFNGIRPGVSSYEDLLDEWGEPVKIFAIDDGDVLTYDTAPFRQIEVVVTNDLVEMIKVELQNALPAEQLAGQLKLDEFDPAKIRDESDQLLGQIFPERGVLFMHAVADANESDFQSLAATAEQQVTHIVIQRIDPVAFALRAENHLHGPYEQNIRDLELALSLDPELAHAHWLLAEVYLATGQAELAQTAANQAVELDPANHAYRLRLARAYELLAEYDDAVAETREALDGEAISPIVKAQALHQMGRLATLGDAAIRQKAIPFHLKAISLADELATSDDTRHRRAALEVLVDAHLAIAQEVAAEDYDDKVGAISQWIARASGLAEDAISRGTGSLEMRLQVAEVALASLADIKPSKDPAPWIEEAQEAADELIEQYDDTLWRQRIEWQLGVAYFQALRIEHTRRQTATALAYGQEAIDNLASGAKSRQAVPDSQHLVGRLYFHIGAIHAVHQKDHEKALLWYDKAVPMLTASVPVTEFAVPRRHGEALVSMGVTYWQLDQRAKALELTQLGAELVEDTVTSGVLDKQSLAVPYGNLATMHKGLGNDAESSKFAKLANNARGLVHSGKTASNNSRGNKSPASARSNARNSDRNSDRNNVRNQSTQQRNQQAQRGNRNQRRSASRPGSMLGR